MPPVVGAQLVMPASAQSAELAADWDDKNTNTLLKLSSRARYSEASGHKIKEFVADLELYFRMCARRMHNLKYFLIVSLGAEKAEKVRRSHHGNAIADYVKFISGGKTLFEKFELKSLFRAELRTHAQAGAKSVAAYVARTMDICSKAYSALATKTAFACCRSFHRGPGRLDDARLLAPRSRVPRADVAKVWPDGTSVQSIAFIAACTRDRR